MSLKLIRNDITKMNTEAIVNTANQQATYSLGIDTAVYKAAGEEQLLACRKEIGEVPEGEAFITPGFNLPAKYIIHAVSPAYIDGESGEEEKLRNCYRNSLRIAEENNIKSISFPLISTGAYGYPKADGMRIAMDECNAFLINHEMEIYIVVFDTKATLMAERIFPQLEAYIDHNYVCEKREEEYGDAHFGSVAPGDSRYNAYANERLNLMERLRNNLAPKGSRKSLDSANSLANREVPHAFEPMPCMSEPVEYASDESCYCEDDFDLFAGESELEKRMAHLSDPFGRYVMYLVESKGKTSTQVQNDAWISRKVYSKINTNQDTYHPDKRTACQICLGLRLNYDEAKDLLRRAGYALTTSEKEDLIWSFFFEMDPEDYDVFDVSDALEKYGLKPIVVLEAKAAK